MPRDYDLYLKDILDCIEKIYRYTAKLDFASFSKEEMVIDAVNRNLEIIGEAARNLSSEIRVNHPEINWRGIIGLRNILIHTYYSLTLKIVWDIVKNELPVLYEKINNLLSKK